MAQTVPRDEQAEEAKVYPGIRSHVQTDAEFRAAMKAGRGSAKLGHNRDLETVADEVRRAMLVP